MIDDELIVDAKEILTELGFEATVERGSNPSLNQQTLVFESTPSTFGALAVYIDPSSSKLNGYEQSLAEDNVVNRKWMIVQGEQEIKTGDVFIRGATRSLVISSTSIGPTKTIIQRIAADQVNGS